MRSAAVVAVLSFLWWSGPARAVAILTGPIVQGPAQGTIVVAWETDVPAEGRVVYGTAGALDRSVDAGALSTRHEVALPDLLPGEVVSYRVYAGTAHSRVHEFSVPPAPGNGLAFLVFGDTRSVPASHRAVVEAMLRRTGHILFNTGDMVEVGGSREGWDDFFAIERPLLASTTSYHVIGNHDLAGGGIEVLTRLFVQPPSPHAPERDFIVDSGGVRFVVLDNAITAHKGKEQKAWLESVLDEGRSLAHIRHLIVLVHHGVHSSGPHGPSKGLTDAGLDDVMRERGVALVLAGHDHSYERGIVDGLRYIISAGGGAPLYKKFVDRGGMIVRHVVNHFIRFEVAGDEVKFDVFRKDGSILESCSLAPAPQGYSCQSNP